MFRYSNFKLNKANPLLAPFMGLPEANRYAGGASLYWRGTRNFVFVNKNRVKSGSQSTEVVPRRSSGHWLILKIPLFVKNCWKSTADIFQRFVWSSPQQATGNLPPLRNSASVSATLHFVSLRVTSCLPVVDSLANPAASYGECARYCGSNL